MPARSALAARNAATPASDTPASGKRARRRSLVTPGSTTSSLPPNDDAREKAAARRRRSATGDGRALEADLGDTTAPAAAPPPPRAPALDAAAIAALYQNCLKLASENKITAKNTWALPLIDHMADLVASDAAARGGATDFARASLTLAAGVSIYAHRVDAVHGDVFRILGGLGRAEAGDDGGDEEENAGDDGGEHADDASAAAPRARRRRQRAAAEADPASTLEPDAAINAKKFDLAFAVDPLFQRTAAKFDGGAADGLLLNTLPLLGGPCLAFDSALVPDDVPSVCGRGGGGGQPLADGPVTAAAATALAALDAVAPSAPLAELAAAAGAPEAEDAGEAAALVQQALADVDAEGVDVDAEEDDDDEEEEAGSTADAGVTTTVKPEPGVAPAVDDEWTTAAVAAAAVATQSGLGGAIAGAHDDDDDDDDNAAALSFGAFGGGDLSDDDGGATRSRTPLADAPSWIAGGGGADPTTPTRATSSAAADDALRWLVGAGVDGDAAPPPTGGKAAWAGATHWRHRAARLRPLVGASDDGTGKQPPPPPSAVRPARRRPDPLDFTALPPLPPSALKRAPARATTLRAARARADTLLPDDVHYSPSALGALFLAPELGAAAAAAAALAAAASPTRRPAASDDDSEGGGLPGGVNPSDDEEEEEAQEGALAAALAAAPAALAWGADPAGPAPAARLAPEAPVAYSRAAKRVDVRALKEALWAEARDAAAASGGAGPLRLADLVPAVAAGRGAAAAPPGQLSPHLVFICLLHLCNEHGLELGREGAGPAAAGAAAVRLGGGADVTVVGVPPV